MLEETGRSWVFWGYASVFCGYLGLGLTFVVRALWSTSNCEIGLYRGWTELTCLGDWGDGWFLYFGFTLVWSWPLDLRRDLLCSWLGCVRFTLVCNCLWLVFGFGLGFGAIGRFGFLYPFLISTGYMIHFLLKVRALIPNTFLQSISLFDINHSAQLSNYTACTELLVLEAIHSKSHYA